MSNKKEINDEELDNVTGGACSVDPFKDKLPPHGDQIRGSSGGNAAVGTYILLCNSGDGSFWAWGKLEDYSAGSTQGGNGYGIKEEVTKGTDFGHHWVYNNLDYYSATEYLAYSCPERPSL